jgi:hypothetical protein
MISKFELAAAAFCIMISAFALIYQSDFIFVLIVLWIGILGVAYTFSKASK